MPGEREWTSTSRTTGRPVDSYTRYPRAILWLLREGSVRIGGQGADSEPPFTTAVSAYYISKTPISNLQYEAHDQDYRRSPASPLDEGPATGISYHDARGYCEWYAELSRKPMRLPTEVEWEYACRGGTTERCFYGDGEAGEYVRDAGNSDGRPGRLQDKLPNPFGLHGMLGGVWEWTGSLHFPYPAQEGDGRDDPAAPGPRVLRGGSFRSSREALGSAVRRAEEPDCRDDDLGFRIVRSL